MPPTRHAPSLPHTRCAPQGFAGSTEQRGSAVALLLFQYIVVAVQLLCSHTGNSRFLPPFPQIKAWALGAASSTAPADVEAAAQTAAKSATDGTQPFAAGYETSAPAPAPSTWARCLRALRTLLVLLPLAVLAPFLDLAAAFSLARSLCTGARSPQHDQLRSSRSSRSSNSRCTSTAATTGATATTTTATATTTTTSRTNTTTTTTTTSSSSKADGRTAWLQQGYVKRRLGIAGLLQACPQAFFHLYVLLLHCFWQSDCSTSPGAALLAVALALDLAVVVMSAQHVAAVFLLVTNWLSWGSWGALLRVVMDCALYIADIGFDVLFVVVSRSPLHAYRNTLIY
jgi:hypothetical protein